jgi:hypothetical protein
MRLALAALLLITATAVDAQPYASMGAAFDDGKAHPQMALGLDMGPLAAEASTFRGAHASGYGLALVGKTSGRLAVLGSVGVYRLKDDTPSTGSGAPSAAARRHESHVAAGVGLSYAFTSMVALRAMLERVEDRGGRATLGLVVRFP